MNKVLCFGEILLRLSPDVGGKWLHGQSMPVYLGGAELNVANALASWDIPVAYCSALPKNYMSEDIRKFLENNGVDVSPMITAGERIGIYYLAQGTDLKNAEVIYDRANSSTASLKPGQVNWEQVFEGVSWFHFSAISPAISADLAEVCREALEAASKKNITISVDLNYRSKLWKWGKQPSEVMPELVRYCNVVMGNIWAAEMMLNVPIPESFQKDKASCVSQAQKSSENVIELFPECSQVAFTFRFDQDESLKYYGTYFTDDKLYISDEHDVSGILDKVGSGDCFMAGLIFGNHHKSNPQQLINFAAAAAVDKMFIVGDATTSRVEDIRKRIKNI